MASITLVLSPITDFDTRYELECELDQTMEMVAVQLMTVTMINFTDFKFVFNAKTLRMNSTLSQNHIEDGNRIFYIVTTKQSEEKKNVEIKIIGEEKGEGEVDDIPMEPIEMKRAESANMEIPVPPPLNIPPAYNRLKTVTNPTPAISRIISDLSSDALSQWIYAAKSRSGRREEKDRNDYCPELEAIKRIEKRRPRRNNNGCLTCGIEGPIRENLINNDNVQLFCLTIENRCKHYYCPHCASLHLLSHFNMGAMPSRCPKCIEIEPVPSEDHLIESVVSRHSATQLLASGEIDEHFYSQFLQAQRVSVGPAFDRERDDLLVRTKTEMEHGNRPSISEPLDIRKCFLGRNSSDIVINNLTAICEGNHGIHTVQSAGLLPSSEQGDIYFEVTINSFNGTLYIGISLNNFDLHSAVGTEADSYSLCSNGSIYYDSPSPIGRYCPTLQNGDIIGVWIKKAHREIWFSKNGSNMGCAFHNIEVEKHWLATASIASNDNIEFNFYGEKKWDLPPEVSHRPPENLQGINIIVDKVENKNNIQCLSEAVLRMPSLKREKSEYDAEDCSICFCEESKISFTNGCHHGYCFDCASRYLQTVMDTGQFPARCPQCLEDNPKAQDKELFNSLINERSLARLLRFGYINADFFDRFCSQQILMAVKPEHSAKCPSCGILAFIGEEIETESKVVCPECNLCFCNKCQVPWHANMNCDEFQEKARGKDISTVDLIKKTSKPCPKCGTPITHYRNHACHHIRPGSGKNGGCPACGYHFCYLCLHKYPHENNEDCPLFCPSNGKCGCPICPDCTPGHPCGHCDGCASCEPDQHNANDVPIDNFQVPEIVEVPCRRLAVCCEGVGSICLIPLCVVAFVGMMMAYSLNDMPVNYIFIPLYIMMAFFQILFAALHYMKNEMGEHLNGFHGIFKECYMEVDGNDKSITKYSIDLACGLVFLFIIFCHLKTVYHEFSMVLVFSPLWALFIIYLIGPFVLSCFEDIEIYFVGMTLWVVLMAFFIPLALKLSGYDIELKYVFISFFIVDGLFILGGCIGMNDEDDDETRVGIMMFLLWISTLLTSKILFIYWEYGEVPLWGCFVPLIFTLAPIVCVGCVGGGIICDENICENFCECECCDACCDYICDCVCCECECCDECCECECCDQCCECECCDQCCQCCDQCCECECCNECCDACDACCDACDRCCDVCCECECCGECCDYICECRCCDCDDR